MTPRARMLAGFAIAVAIGVVFTQLAIINRPAAPPNIQGVLLPEGRALKHFSLLDHMNRPFTNSELKGRWHIISYGFTTCPDICPTTLSQLATVRNELAGTSKGFDEDLRILFYSVDHRRDTVAQMASYVPYFHAEFIGLTHLDDPENPHLPFEQSLGIVAQLVPRLGPDADPTRNEYDVNHGVTLFLVNPQGELQAIFEPDRIGPQQYNFDPKKILQDYLAIRDYLG